MGYRAARCIVAAVATYFGLWLLIGLFGPYDIGATARIVVQEAVPVIFGIAAGSWAFRGRS